MTGTEGPRLQIPMSRYEILRDELRRLREQQLLGVMAPAVAGAILAGAFADGSARLWVGLTALIVLPLVLHGLWFLGIPAYRAQTGRSSAIRNEIACLRKEISLVFGKYRARKKHEQFKRVYALSGRAVRELEEALAVGMFRERREVFVTAFMRDGVAVRVTASIGTPFRCRAADNPARWKEHAARLGCDEIRQYHNHPEHSGSTVPSNADIRTSGEIRRLLGPHGSKLRSLIICWNDLREWKVIEYDEAGGYSLHFEFDAGIT
ncbi:MAG: hypothetical protein OEV14_05565 [Gammaproteobacteria bacterium]|nr:hypothetical protein [Gammaproteobacteria bacterium]